MKSPQVDVVEEIAEPEAEWYVALIPHMGISSFLHLGILMLLYISGKDFGAVKQTIVEPAVFKPSVPTKPPDVPQPDPPVKLDPNLPTDRDVEDQEKVDLPITGERDPAHEKDMEVSDHYETDDNEDGHGASGDPNQKGEVNTAFQIDSFVKGAGMRAVRGKGEGTGASERFGHRGPGGRKNLTKIGGGGKQTEDAVRKALEWLQKHQSSDGRWDCAAFDGCCKGSTKCTGPGTTDYNVGVSALAMLAYLAHGETSGSGPYADTVRRGLSWLKGQQSSDGCVGPKNIEKHPYNHTIATMALAEAVAMGEYNYKDAAQKAVNYLLACQNTKEKGGGWRYHNYNIPGTASDENGNNDTSVTGWALMALKSARVAELTVPDDAFERASLWLDSIYEAREYKGVFGYLRKANGSLGLVHQSPYTTTSVGVLVRLLMGQNKGVNEGTATLLEKTPDWKNPNLYYWYYATLALFQVGGDSWTQWNKPMKDSLCQNQETKGCQDGSWDPAQDTWGDQGGRVYTTAMGALCLEVYYRYKKGMTVKH